MLNYSPGLRVWGSHECLWIKLRSLGHFMLVYPAHIEDLMRTAVWCDALLQTVNSGRVAMEGWVPEDAIRARLVDVLSHSRGLRQYMG